VVVGEGGRTGLDWSGVECSEARLMNCVVCPVTWPEI
jgi:hypothetical protein